MRPRSHSDRASRAAVGLAALGLVFLLIGCSGESSPVAAADPTGKRYASFAPSITQMLIDLGLGDRVIAVGEYDPVKPVHAQIVGDLYRIDYEKLLTLRPTDVFLQPSRQGVPARLEELAKAHGWTLHSRQIETRDDVLDVLGGMIGEAIGDKAAAQQLRDTVDRQWQALARLTADQPRRSCLVVVGRNPIVCAGPATFMSQMVEAAGGRNAVTDAAVRYPVVDREKMLTLAPEVVLWVRGGVGGPVPSEPRDALGIPETLSAQVEIVDDPAALLPSSSMPRIIAQMARLLHPSLAPRIDEVMAGGGVAGADSSKPRPGTGGTTASGARR